VRIFGIDPGSERTGYGCVETDGTCHQLVACGAITALAGDPFPQRLARIHRELAALLASCRPDCVAVENLFHASNARSALKLGHARGVAILAAVEAGCEVVEYTPAEVKRAVVGYGRAEKQQVQRMVALLLGLDKAPSPYDASDALAVAICHVHSTPGAGRLKAAPTEADKRRLQAAPTEADKRRQQAAPSGKNDVGAAFRRPGTRAKSWRQYRPPANG
jgi:crossover junction endodeoxyribonuclease RuvC